MHIQLIVSFDLGLAHQFNCPTQQTLDYDRSSVITSIWYDDDVTYFLQANYFESFANTPTISKIQGRQVLDSKGQPTVQTEIYCTVNNKQQVSNISTFHLNMICFLSDLNIAQCTDRHLFGSDTKKSLHRLALALLSSPGNICLFVPFLSIASPLPPLSINGHKTN